MRKMMVVAAATATAAVSGAVAVAPAAERQTGETARAATEQGAAQPAATPTLTIRPRAARRGGSVVFYGSGFRPLVRVTLLAGPPESAAVKIGSAKTDEQGEFVAPIAIERRVRPGRYVALACRHDCRVKATAMFRVLE